MKFTNLLLIAAVSTSPIDDLSKRFKLFAQSATASSCKDVIDNQSFNCGERCSGALSGTILDAAIHNLDSEAAGYVSVLPSQNSIIVAFRSTKAIQNVLADINVLHSKPDFDIGAYYGAEVHSGFEENYMSIRDVIQQSVQKLAAQDQYKSYDIVFVGHSLGGATANMAAVDFSFQTKKKYDSRVSLYTFGQPRVGDQRWADLYSTLSFNSRYYRLIQEFDPAPQFPFTNFGYRHNGQPYYLQSGNVLSLCPLDDTYNGESSVCRVPQLKQSINSHLTAKSYFQSKLLTCRGD
jgi:predicted lipase